MGAPQRPDSEVTAWLPPAPDDDDDDGIAGEAAAAAGWWHRLLAFLVDLAAATVIATLLAIPWVDGSSPETITRILFFAFLGGWLLVTAGATAKTDGQSLGKWIGGLWVVRRDGTPATPGSSLLRDTAYRVPCVVPFYAVVDGLLALGAARRTLHDRMAETRVVRTPGARRRALALIGALAVAALLWAGVEALVLKRGNAGYTRSEFVHDCVRATSGGARCGCAYDALVSDFGHDTVDAFEQADDAVRRAMVDAAQTMGGC